MPRLAPPIPQLCRDHNVSSATVYTWQAKYSGMDTSLIARLKKIEAEENLKTDIVQEAFQKVVKQSQCKEVAQHMVQRDQIRISKACRLVGINETCYR
jgi:putative transposase